MCQGKAGLYEIHFEYREDGEVKSQINVGVIESDNGGVSILQPEYVFRRRLSTKVQSEKIETEALSLNSQGKIVNVEVKAIVSYQIQDKRKAAVKYGLEKDAIENGVKQLAERWVKAKARVTALIRQPNNEKKAAPPAYQYLEEENTELTAVEKEMNAAGIMFNSVVFTSAILADRTEKTKHTDLIVDKIYAAIDAELQAARTSAGKEALVKEIKQKIAEDHQAELGQLKTKLRIQLERNREKQNTLNSHEQEVKIQSDFNLFNQSKEFEDLQLVADRSTIFFNKTLKPNNDYEVYNNIRCLNYRPEMFALKGLWRLLPDWLTGRKTVTVTVEKDQIGLIKFQGQPEFLKPGTYCLPASAWVGAKELKPGSLIQHGAMTIRYVARGELGYAEDLTLRDDTLVHRTQL